MMKDYYSLFIGYDKLISSDDSQSNMNDEGDCNMATLTAFCIHDLWSRSTGESGDKHWDGGVPHFRTHLLRQIPIWMDSW